MPPKPSEEDLKNWHRWFAIECNNQAWQLTEASSRLPGEEKVMLYTAYASAYHWSQVGTELHAARAEMLLGHVHALLGQGELAIRFARSSFDFVTSRESPDWEIALAHAILAHAGAVANDATLHERFYAKAKALGDAIVDPEDRAIFEATFRAIPVPVSHL